MIATLWWSKKQKDKLRIGKHYTAFKGLPLVVLLPFRSYFLFYSTSIVTLTPPRIILGKAPIKEIPRLDCPVSMSLKEHFDC